MSTPPFSSTVLPAKRIIEPIAARPTAGLAMQNIEYSGIGIGAVLSAHARI